MSPQKAVPSYEALLAHIGAYHCSDQACISLNHAIIAPANASLYAHTSVQEG